ncbi:transposase [Piscirickettsia salmonis]|uniref:transposase n=1 Tax=Piscirickettsia salmonis TaxID=1238 RepID=UPI00249E2CFA|nr:transposase [Piscirickettsia salmonis]
MLNSKKRAQENNLSETLYNFSQQCRIVYTDCWRAYNALDISEFKHYRINHNKRFAENQNHINGIENFWNQTKRHMRKFNGVPRQHFNFFLKEAEWRFNMGSPKELLPDLKKLLKELY